MNNFLQIWCYWEQGWDKIPYVVQYCKKSWELLASNFQINYLDINNIYKYIDIPDIINEKDFPKALRSDYIRIALLEKFGGVWIDSTVFLNTNLYKFVQEQLSNCDFFCFMRYPYETISSWFLISRPHSIIVSKQKKYFEEQLNNSFYNKNKHLFLTWNSSCKDYYIFHRCFSDLIKNDPIFNKEFHKINYIDSKKSLILANYDYTTETPDEFIKYIYSDVPMFKMSHGRKKEEFSLNSLLNLLKQKYNIEKDSNKLEEAVYSKIGHIHTAKSTKSVRLFNSDINTPKETNYSGFLFSESDLNIHKDIHHFRYHIINISAKWGKLSNAQILIPFNSNDIYIRHSISDNSFSEPEKLVTSKELFSIKNQLYWLNFQKNLINLQDTYTSQILTNDFFQIFFNYLPKFIHFEIKQKESNIVYLHIENSLVIKNNIELLKRISCITNLNLSLNDNIATFSLKENYSINESLNLIYKKTISYLINELKL